MIKIYTNYLFKTKIWICIYRIIMISFMVVLVNLLNIEMINMEKIVRDYKQFDPEDKIFILFPTYIIYPDELNKIEANEIFSEYKKIENIDIFYSVGLLDSRIYIVNRNYFDYLKLPINDKKDCLEMCVYVGENRIKSLFPLGLKDNYKFSDGIDYSVAGVLPRKLVRLGTNLMEVQLEDQVIFVTNDNLYEHPQNFFYNMNFVTSVFMIKINNTSSLNGWNEVFEYSQLKLIELNEINTKFGLDVQFSQSNIGGRVEKERKYLTQLWDKNKIETYSLISLLLGVLGSLFLYELVRMKNFFNVLRLNGISVGKLVLILFLEQTILYEVGITIGIFLCYQLSITLFLDLSFYILLAGIMLAALLSMYGGINIYQRNLIDGLRERN